MSPEQKAAANAIALKAQAMIVGTEREAPAREAWAVAAKQIDAYATKSTKQYKNYEHHHLTQSARAAFLEALVEGCDYSDCTRRAFERVGIEPMEDIAQHD